MGFDVITYAILKKKKADLNDLGLVPASELPSYVDTITEVENKAALPATGQTGMIYAIKTGTGTRGDAKGDCYRWTGTQYVLIADPYFYDELAKKQDKLTPGKGITIFKDGAGNTVIKINFTTFDIKGTVEYYVNLPTSGMEEGDTYYVKNDDPDLAHTKGFYMWLEESATSKYWLKIDVDTQWGKILGDITKQTDLMEELNKKLNKSTNKESVYAVDKNGNQINVPYTNAKSSNSLALRDNAGRIRVGNAVEGEHAVNLSQLNTSVNAERDRAIAAENEIKDNYVKKAGDNMTGNLSMNGHIINMVGGSVENVAVGTADDAVPKKYIDNADDKKVDKLTTTTGNQVYARKGGVESSYTVSDYWTANTVALRYDNGRLSVGNPVSDYDALNLGYFNDHFKYIGYSSTLLKGIFVYSDLTHKNNSGFDFDSAGAAIKNATESDILNRKAIWVTGYGAITTSNYDYAIKHALIDATGLTYTTTEQDSAVSRIGAVRHKTTTTNKTYLYALDKNGDKLIDLADVGKVQDVQTRVAVTDSYATVVDTSTGIAKIDLSNVTQYKQVSTFASLSGNKHIWYYLDKDYVTAGKTYKKGNYIYTGSDFELVADVGGGSSTSPVFLGIVNPGGSLPTKRPDDTELVIGDYVKPKEDATFPYTVDSVTFKSPRDTAVFMSAPNNWLVNASVYQKTAETPVSNKANESINGSSSGSVYQADINIENAAAINTAVTGGSVTKPGVGQIRWYLKNRKNGSIIDTTISNIVFTDDAQTLTSKTINADTNTISNLEVDNFKTTAISKTIPDSGATDEKLTTEKAVNDYFTTKLAKTLGRDGTTLKLRSPNNTVLSTVTDAELCEIIKDTSVIFKNKTINADNNTISNLETDNLKDGILDTTSLYTANHTHVASSKLIAEVIEDSKRGFTFTGYVTSVRPEGAIREGELWYNTTSKDMPLVFPINVYKYTNGAWSSTTTAYTPKALDLWSNKNNGHGYYWFGNDWNLLDFNVGVDNTTIDYTTSNQLEVKDGGVTLVKLADQAKANVNKVYSIDSNGKTILRRINQYKRVDKFSGVSGDTYTEYYLDTPCVIGTVSYGIGLYVWDSVEGFVQVADLGGGSGGDTPIFVGLVYESGTFPTERPDGEALIIGDYVKPNPNATFPFTVEGITFSTSRDSAVFMSEGNWILNASTFQTTSETPLYLKEVESINGSSSSAAYQADINIENAAAINAAASYGTFTKESGHIKLTIKDRKDNSIITGSINDVVFLEDDQVLKNKVISADNNTIKELVLNNFKTGVVSTAVPESGESDTKILTEKAVKTALDALKFQVTIMPSASADLAGKVYEYIGITTATYTQGYFYLCTADGGTYKWVNIPTMSVFEDVTVLPATNISSDIIYRIHSLSVIKNKYDMNDPTRYIVSTNGITDTLTGDTTPWVLVSSQWTSKWLSRVKVNDASGVITKYEVEGSVYIIDTLSYKSVDNYSLFYYVDTTWHQIGAGAGGSGDYIDLDNKPQINGVTLQGNKTSFETKIFWEGTQAEYDALASHPDYTLFAIEDGAPESGGGTSTGYTKAETDALLNLKQNITATDLQTTNKQVVPAINELFADIRAIVGGITIKVVDTQPTTPTNNTIYYIGTTQPYIVKLYTLSSGWTDLGTSDVDLTDYQKKNVTITDYAATTVEGILTEIKGLLDKKLTGDDIVNSLSSLESGKALSAYQGNVLAAMINLRLKISDIEDVLTSYSTTKALSANQGRALKEMIGTKQNKITISTASPSGGVSGDIWFKYEA